MRWLILKDLRILRRSPFFVALQPSEHDAGVVGQGEEGARRPAVRHGDAQLTPSIVLDE